jgi:hypothetical protein
MLQVFVKKFHEHYQLKQEVENKQLDNIILILCHLYNFKVHLYELAYVKSHVWRGPHLSVRSFSHCYNSDLGTQCCNHDLGYHCCMLFPWLRY